MDDHAPEAIRREMGLSVILGIQVSVMFVLAPLAATRLLSSSPALIDIFRVGLAAAAVITVNHSRPAMIAIGASFLLLMAVTFLLRTGAAETASYVFRQAVTTGFDIAVAAAVARVAFGPGRVTVHRILGGVVLYLQIGLIFASAYRIAAVLLTPAFSGLPDNRHALGQLLYFSLSTLTTTGFGDIAPLHPFVRSLANLEGVIGQLFPATLLARLVTLHAAAGPED